MPDTMRNTTPQERLALKAAVRRAVKLAGGGANAQHATRVAEPALSKYSSSGEPAHHCPVDIALDLDREAGAPVILSALAELQGFSLVRGRGAEAAAFSLADVAPIASSFAATLEAVTAALADGRLDAAERRALGQHLADLLKAVTAAQARVGG